MQVSGQVPIDKDWVQRENHRDEVTRFMSGRVISSRGIPFERMIQRRRKLLSHSKSMLKDRGG